MRGDEATQLRNRRVRVGQRAGVQVDEPVRGVHVVLGGDVRGLLGETVQLRCARHVAVLHVQVRRAHDDRRTAGSLRYVPLEGGDGFRVVAAREQGVFV